MKNKIIYLIAGVILSGYTAFAQDDTSTGDTVEKADKGSLKPEAGDIGIGISAIPYLNYLGNFFGKTNDNDLNLGGQTLYFKYFLTDASAVRAALYVNNSTGENNYYVQDDGALAQDPTSTAQVVDTRNYSSTTVALTLGYELRKDYNRFTFLYGANVGYRFSRGTKYEYSYGNPMTALNPTPSSVFGFTAGARTLSSDPGSNHTLSAGLFAGIEYFIAKRFAVGADFSLGYSYSWSTQADASYEQWDGSNVHQFDRPSSPGNNSSNLNTSQYSSPLAAGEIYVHFYF